MKTPTKTADGKETEREAFKKGVVQGYILAAENIRQEEWLVERNPDVFADQLLDETLNSEFARQVDQLATIYFER